LKPPRHFLPALALLAALGACQPRQAGQEPPRGAARVTHPAAPKQPVPPPVPPPWDEKSQAARMALLERQPEILQHALDSLQPQRPGRIDLFTLGFAGDGSERVFANEVEYFAQLMQRRFDAKGHALSLVNSPDPDDRLPLATVPNLRAALAAIGQRMDPEEDVLVLFLTSHGSKKHKLYVDLQVPPERLEQVRPADLRKALDEAGIRWRVLIVSACYSGGFVPDLKSPNTLVITAARSDRTSFGCGNESKITWFGDAFLAHALNETTDFEAAFTRARALIREWEARDEEKASEPQMAAGVEIGPKLASWRTSATPGAPVPFTGK
jgi:hypothetical protein